MKQYLISILLVSLALGVIPNDAYALFKNAKVTLVVVDEVGSPLEGVNAGVGFEKNIGWGTDATATRGLTDANGHFVASGSCNGHIGYGARKEGYYRSHYDYDFKDLGAFGWKPWNLELKVVMRKIENPVPMYKKDIGKHINFEIPELNKDIGFDLIIADWVAPFGNGKTADLFFNFKRDSLNPQNFKSELKIAFSSEKDGIIKIEQGLMQGSEFKLARYAPEEGYQDSLVQYSERTPRSWFKNTFKENDNFLFRIRSKVGDKGKVVSAMYGKIIGPIRFAPARSKKTTIIQFKYYLNPDGTRNLEHDPNRNLFFE